MRTLTIRIPDEGESGGFDVVDSDGRLADGLCFDEMIGQLISLAHPKLGAPRYAMKTPDEWAEDRRRSEERGAQIRAANTSAQQAMLDALRQWRHAEQADDSSEYANAQVARDLAIQQATGEWVVSASINASGSAP